MRGEGVAPIGAPLLIVNQVIGEPSLEYVSAASEGEAVAPGPLLLHARLALGRPTVGPDEVARRFARSLAGGAG